MMPQRLIANDETEMLIRAMVDAHRFLTVEDPFSSAKFQNKTRMEHARETLAIALGPYQMAIEKFQDNDQTWYPT